MSQQFRLRWMVRATVVVYLVILSVACGMTTEPTRMSFGEFREAVAAGGVEHVEIRDLELSGEFTEDYATAHGHAVAFETVGPVDRDLEKLLASKEVDYAFTNPDETGKVQQFLISGGPLLVLTIVGFVIVVVVAGILIRRRNV